MMSVRKNIRGLSAFVPGQSIESLQRELGVETPIIKLASNENLYGASQAVYDEIRRHSTELHYYPEPSGLVLKKSLVSHHKIDIGTIILGNGSEELLMLAAMSVVSPGDEVIISEYCFITYSLIAKKVDAKIVYAPCTFWKNDLDIILSKVTQKTKLVFLANPRNPTGTILSKHELVYFLEKLPAHILLILDEAYYEYVDHDDYISGISLLSRYENLFVTRTFSKIHGLASLRIGYGFGTKHFIDEMNKLKMPFNLGKISLVAAAAAINSHDHIHKSKQLNLQEIKNMKNVFNNIGIEFIMPNANFITFFTGKHTMPINRFLKKNRVIVRELSYFNMPDYTRVTIGTNKQNDIFLSLLLDYVNQAGSIS